MTVNIADGIINFITKNELHIPIGKPFEIDTNTIINIPDNMVMIISSDKYTAQYYGVYVNPSPLIISSNETDKNIVIPVSWDGIDRWGVVSFLHDYAYCVKLPVNTCIAKAVLVSVSQYCHIADANEE